MDAQVELSILKSGGEVVGAEGGGSGSGGESGSSETGDVGVGMTLQSLQSVKGGEKLIQAIDIISDELNLDSNNWYNEYSSGNSGSSSASGSGMKLSTNPLLQGLSPCRFLVKIFRSIPTPDIASSLLLLPFHYISRLLRCIILILNRSIEIEITSKIAILTVTNHYNQLITTPSLLPELCELKLLLGGHLHEYKVMVGSNIAGEYVV